MRTFVYLSEAKVDALSARIPRDFQQRLTGDAASPDRFGKALATEQYLESQGSLGGAADRTEFVRGINPFGYGVVADYSQELAYFGAQVGPTWVFLIGPRDGMIAEMEPITTGGMLDAKSGLTHAGLKALNQLLRSEETGDLQRALQTFDAQLVLGLRQGLTLFPPATTPLIYVAKALHRVRTASESFVLATPIFIAAAPETPKKDAPNGGGGWLKKLFGK